MDMLLAKARSLGLGIFLIFSFVLTACSPGSPDVFEGGGDASGGEVTIKVLSNRADLISGGNALVEVVLKDESSYSRADRRAIYNSIRVNAGSVDVTDAFALRENDRYMGVVENLPVGETILTATASAGGSSITVENHPIGGPVFSGPHVQPWNCTTGNNGLGEPVDDDCNALETVITWRYKNQTGQYGNYDPENPPNDVAEVTLDHGETVPFIVRQEKGTHNRGIYTLAVIYNPNEEWFPWAKQKGWNGKLHYPFGASCGTSHSQSNAQGVENDRALSQGFMVATSSLNVLGNNCNTVTSAESVMMLKEHIVENYGEIRYTMAEGCSGGSIGQQMIGNSYPGLLQGIQPNCSYMDIFTTGMEVVDCEILENYYGRLDTTGGGPAGGNITEAQKGFISGHQSGTSCVAWGALFSPAVNPVGGCGAGSATWRHEGDTEDRSGEYHPVNNPTGCRGGVPDFNINQIGKRPESIWNESPRQETRDAEAAYGGFARLPFDNIGVQYGWEALNATPPQITPQQFVHLNVNIGAVDVDFVYQTERRRADEGSELLYRAGGVNDASQLDGVVMVDLRGSSNAEIHTDYHSWAMRARLERANGHSDNHVVWSHKGALIPTPQMANDSFNMIDDWLTAVEADTRDISIADKIAEFRPAEAVDACYEAEQKITDMTYCNNSIPYFASPRIAAGGPFTHHIARCETKPFDRADYTAISPLFTEDLLQQLEDLYGETGVCDWSKEGFGVEESQPWLTYENGPGGEPLGEPPVAQDFQF